MKPYFKAHLGTINIQVAGWLILNPGRYGTKTKDSPMGTNKKNLAMLRENDYPQ